MADELIVSLSPAVTEYLLAWAHLRAAEEMSDPKQNPEEVLRTSAADFIPPKADEAIYAALAEAALQWEDH